MTTRPPTPFEIARDDLRRIGIKLTMHPGTYCVNFAQGSTEATAYFTDDLADAVEHGRAMAASALAGFIERGRRAQEAVDQAMAAATVKPARRRRRRAPPRSAKARRRALIKAHNRKLRSRALRQVADIRTDDDKAE
jgi:hypothetical protein